MAIDLEAIKRKMAELNGERKSYQSNVQLWKPAPGVYRIRCVPWKGKQDGEPFYERQFYYLGKRAGLLAPSQFGKPDPVDELRRKLFSTKKEEDRAVAKKLMPKMRAYAAIVVRGEEDNGVLVWSLGSTAYKRLLGFFVDEDGGDFLDPVDGYDLKVTITKVQGKDFADTTIDLAKKQSPLSDDPEKMQKLLNSTPDIDQMYQLKSYGEVEKVLNEWLNEGVEASDDDAPATRGAEEAVDEVEKLANDVKKSAEAKKAPAAKKAPPPVVDLEDAKPAKKISLEDAFRELENDD